ncbi:DedA family protein [Algiphilus sp.]|uniref:DedA family protein n=1 Tax=Algiphilus sp. TaxID=1872431 RepID=UPI003B51741A
MIESILVWAGEHREQAVWLVPLLAFMETCVGIGLFVPSLMLVIVTSVFYANDWANLWVMATMAMIGSSLGDHVGYYAGRAIGHRVHHWRVIQRNAERWERTETMVRRYGVWAIFIGRFIPAIRSLVPAMMGVTEFERARYTLFDVAACSLWALGLVAIVKGAHTLFLPS